MFQSWIAELRASLPPANERRICSLRRRLHDAIDAEVQGGNVRVILWLADRMKLIQPAEREMPPSSLHDLLRTMSDRDIKEFESLKD
jgi:hypothetical protein